MTNLPADVDLGRYRSIPEYIYGITREIWEDRGIGGKLMEYYAPDVVVRAPTGITVGNAGVTAQTLETLHQFPDRQLIGEDVIWKLTGNGAFLSSHRLVSVMTHTGDGLLGKAGGNAVRSYIIAECWVQEHQVKEEWLVRDQAAFARCLGIEPQSLARDSLERDLMRGRETAFFRPEHDRTSRYSPCLADDPTVSGVCARLEGIWGRKQTSGIREHYFEGASLHAPGGMTYHGHADIDRFIISYLAAFPDANFRIDSAIVNRDMESPVRVALRWSLHGEHTGFGRFGEATGATVHIMGLSHLYMTRERVHLEWLVTDEVSIWKQIYAHRESRAGA